MQCSNRWASEKSEVKCLSHRHQAAALPRAESEQRLRAATAVCGGVRSAADIGPCPVRRLRPISTVEVDGIVGTRCVDRRQSTSESRVGSCVNTVAALSFAPKSRVTTKLKIAR